MDLKGEGNGSNRVDGSEVEVSGDYDRRTMADLEQRCGGSFAVLARDLRLRLLKTSKYKMVRALGYTQGYAHFLDRIETGARRPSPRLLAAYASHFEIPVSTLIHLAAGDFVRAYTRAVREKDLSRLRKS